jgi:hypothetical protein
MATYGFATNQEITDLSVDHGRLLKKEGWFINVGYKPGLAVPEVGIPAHVISANVFDNHPVFLTALSGEKDSLPKYVIVRVRAFEFNGGQVCQSHWTRTSGRIQSLCTLKLSFGSGQAQSAPTVAAQR